jgi:hypothetical protein
MKSTVCSRRIQLQIQQSDIYSPIRLACDENGGCFVPESDLFHTWRRMWNTRGVHLSDRLSKKEKISTHPLIGYVLILILSLPGWFQKTDACCLLMSRIGHVRLEKWPLTLCCKTISNLHLFILFCFVLFPFSFHWVCPRFWWIKIYFSCFHCVCTSDFVYVWIFEIWASAPRSFKLFVSFELVWKSETSNLSLLLFCLFRTHILGSNWDCDIG